MKKNMLQKTKGTSLIPRGYMEFIEGLKSKIQSSQIKAALKVNSELIVLYWPYFALRATKGILRFKIIPYNCGPAIRSF